MTFDQALEMIEAVQACRTLADMGIGPEHLAPLPSPTIYTWRVTFGGWR